MNGPKRSSGSSHNGRVRRWSHCRRPVHRKHTLALLALADGDGEFLRFSTANDAEWHSLADTV
jgi:hypothetical protein